MTTSWMAGWTQAPTDITLGDLEYEDVTLRWGVTGSIDGEQLRIGLSNRYGSTPLLVGEAAVRVGGITTPLRFDGSRSVLIPAGGDLVSDAADVPVLAGGAVEVDVHLPRRSALTTGNMAPATWHPSSPGNHVGSDRFPSLDIPMLPLPEGGAIDAPAPILSSVEVSRHAPSPVVVCLGDSITVAGWPDRAAARLRSRGIAVVNRGIAGNRLRIAGAGPMGGLFGPSGQDRFDQDVLGTAGRTHVVIALGTNDLGHPGSAAPIEELPTSRQLIEALESLERRSRDAGIGVLYATITPFLPAEDDDLTRDVLREEVNTWIRAQARRVPIIDADAALRREDAPGELDPLYDSGDHLHPNHLGTDRLAEVAARAIGDAIPR